MNPWRVVALTVLVALAALSLVVAAPPPVRTVQAPCPVPLPVEVYAAPPVVLPSPPPANCPVDPAAPTVALRVRVPACVAVGQPLEYRICVENTSCAAAHHVIVRNPMTPAARFVCAKPAPSTIGPELLWQLGTLCPGACREIVLTLEPTGIGDVRNCARVQFEHGQCVCTRVLRPELTLRKCGPAEAILFDALTYKLVVKNVGAAAANGVVLSDPLPEGLEHESGKRELSWDLGTLAPGEEKCIDYQVIAKRSGKLCNRASVIAAGVPRQDATSCVLVGEAELKLDKGGPERHSAGRPATYHLTVTNPGGVGLTGVVIHDPIPANAEFVSASNGGELKDGEVRWTIGALPPGARRTVQVTLKAKEAGEVINRATATADRGLSGMAEARTLFEGGAGLTVDIDEKDDPVEMGSDTLYTVTILNQGAAPATGVVLTVTVPDQMEVTNLEGASAAPEKPGKVVSFAPVMIPARREAVYRIHVKAVRAGDVRFKVDLTADQLTSGQPVHREESTTIYDAGAAPAAPPPTLPPVPF